MAGEMQTHGPHAAFPLNQLMRGQLELVHYKDKDVMALENIYISPKLWSSRKIHYILDRIIYPWAINSCNEWLH